MAASRTERLELQVAREATLIEKLDAQFARELGEVLKLANATVRELVRELRANKDGRVVSTQANLGRVLGLKQRILRVLEEAGFATVAEAATNTPLDQLAEQVLRGSTIAQQALELSAGDLKAIATFKAIRFEELLRLEAAAAQSLARTVLDGTLGLRPIEALVDDVAELFDSTDRQARSTYDTALSIYSRQVDQLHATGKDDELFYYAGPLDTKTRPFCLARVGKVFTREELENADNGQLPNPLLTGGGFNCRHVAKRVSKLDRELEDLRESGKRAEYVQEQIDALTRRAA